jgi:LDH2 family malate/lactate/ureidoglycolate dehydrogenase
MIAIDVATLRPIEEFDATVGALIEEVKNAPLAQGFDEIFYPGELEDRADQANRAAGGVALPEQTWNDLTTVAATTGIPLTI